MIYLEKYRDFTKKTRDFSRVEDGLTMFNYQILILRSAIRWGLNDQSTDKNTAQPEVCSHYQVHGAKIEVIYNGLGPSRWLLQPPARY